MPTRTKSKHPRENAPISDDDARKALVAMLFKQLLGLLAAKTSIQRLANTSPTSDSWYGINEVLSSIKHMISNFDVEFSREALEKYGAAIELSADGHRVGWKSSNRHEMIRPHTVSSAIHDHHIHSHQTNDLPKETLIQQEMVLGLADSKTTSLHTPTTV